MEGLRPPRVDRVAGLIYRPFAEWVAEDYGITVEVAPELSLQLLASLAASGAPVIASECTSGCGGRIDAADAAAI